MNKAFKNEFRYTGHFKGFRKITLKQKNKQRWSYDKFLRNVNLKSSIANMTKEEVNRYLYGSWYS